MDGGLGANMNGQMKESCHQNQHAGLNCWHVLNLLLNSIEDVCMQVWLVLTYRI